MADTDDKVIVSVICLLMERKRENRVTLSRLIIAYPSMV
jgi:hypothetical protein